MDNAPLRSALPTYPQLYYYYGWYQDQHLLVSAEATPLIGADTGAQTPCRDTGTSISQGGDGRPGTILK
jgi:hypothetical protein